MLLQTVRRSRYHYVTSHGLRESIKNKLGVVYAKQLSVSCNVQEIKGLSEDISGKTLTEEVLFCYSKLMESTYNDVLFGMPNF